MIDALDKKILLALLGDARMPIARIAKLPGLTREIVRYRMRNLIDEGVIKGFIARIDQSNFCSGVANFSAKLNRIDTVRLNAIITALRKHSNINWITGLCGTTDFMCTILYKNVEDLSKTVSDITAAAGSNLQEHQLSLYIGEYKFDRRGLISEKGVFRSTTETTFVAPKNSVLSHEDKILLASLASDCRMNASELAAKSGLSEDAVRIRIRKFERTGIIRGYTIILDTSKLGYEGYQIGLQFEQMTSGTIAKIKGYADSNPYVTFCARTSGKHNVMLALEAKNRQHFKEMLQELRSTFANTLKSYEFQLSLQEHKEVFVAPELILE